MDYLQRIYQSDAARLCATHASNDRPAPQDDERTAAEEEYAGRLIAESVPSVEDRIQDAYNRVRDALCANVQGGELLWDAHNLFLELSEENAAQTKDNGTWGDGFFEGRAGAYQVAASHMARIFELQYEEVRE